MKIINSDTPTKLATLIKSGEVDDKTRICIYDKDGKFLLRGAWYEDKVLEYSERFGEAHKAGTGHSMMFRLI